MEQTDRQDHILSHADALTKNGCKSYIANVVPSPPKYKTNLIKIGFLSSPKLLPLRLIKIDAKKNLKKEKVEKFPQHYPTNQKYPCSHHHIVKYIQGLLL